MKYKGKLRIGAVYQSHDRHITRRVTAIRDGCVYYVYMHAGQRPTETALTEDMFREFTKSELLPDAKPCA